LAEILYTLACIYWAARGLKIAKNPKKGYSHVIKNFTSPIYFFERNILRPNLAPYNE